MNYLAHAYLSFNYTEILIGNMISDYVKGKHKYDYSPEIQSGIMLHRLIDEFTDAHEVTKAAKEYFRPKYRLYAGAFIDVAYDHFLATDKEIFPDENTLKEFSLSVYDRINPSVDTLPIKFQKMFLHMSKHDWLFHYRFKEGIEKSFEGLKYRAKYIDETHTAYKLFNEHFVELKMCYETFFPELKTFVKKRLF